MRHILFCLLIAIHVHAWAVTEIPESTLPDDATQTTDVKTSPSTDTTTTEPTIVPAPQSLPSEVLRALSKYTGSLHFSPFSTWIPLKVGLSAGYIYSDRWTIEGEYTTGHLSTGIYGADFGKIMDRRLGVQSRFYPWAGSFNFMVGFFRSEFNAELGNTILSHMTAVPQTHLLKFESYGPLFGISNRWQWKTGITAGVDWLSMYVPAFARTEESALDYVNNGSDRSGVDKVSSLVRRVPQFDILKLQLGYNF